MSITATLLMIALVIVVLIAMYFIEETLESRRREEVIYQYLMSRLRHPSQRHYHPENDYDD